MEITRVQLTDFRNYQHAEASFSQGLNLIVGRNGQGKTNLLEAIHLLSTLGSHRAGTNAALIRHGADEAIVRAAGVSGEREMTIDAQIRPGSGVRMLVNKVPLGRSRDLPTVLVTVLFSPEDLALVKGGPDERRRLLDLLAARLKPSSAHDRLELDKVLRQRNGVLKAAQSSPRALKTLDVWDEQLITASTAVLHHRLRALELLAPAAADGYREISGGGEQVALTYQASWSDEPSSDREAITASMRHALEQARSRDIDRAVSTVGPHRDDLLIELSGAEARTYASQGEQRTLSLALRLAERIVLTAAHDRQPILLLDDVFSELDDRRRLQLSDVVAGAGQTIATSTSSAGVPTEAARLLTIEDGKVIQGD